MACTPKPVRKSSKRYAVRRNRKTGWRGQHPSRKRGWARSFRRTLRWCKGYHANWTHIGTIAAQRDYTQLKESEK